MMIKRSFLASIALLACAAMASAAYATYDRVADFAVSAYAKVKAFVFEGIALVAGADSQTKQVPVVLVQAKAFVMRLAKRERPVVTTSWRMCPSI